MTVAFPKPRVIPDSPKVGVALAARVWGAALLWIAASLALAAALVWSAVLLFFGHREIFTVYGIANVLLFAGMLACFGAGVVSRRNLAARWICLALAAVVILGGWITWEFILQANVSTLGEKDRKPFGLATMSAIVCALTAAAAWAKPALKLR